MPALRAARVTDPVAASVKMKVTALRDRNGKRGGSALSMIGASKHESLPVGQHFCVRRAMAAFDPKLRSAVSLTSTWPTKEKLEPLLAGV
jgi:hypothetical protein